MTEQIIAREGRGGKGEGTTRAMRGLALYRDRGDEIVTYLDGTMGVPSATEEGVLYVVDLAEESCDCPSYRYSGKPCKHVFSGLLYVAKHRGRLPFRPVAPVRSSRRCGRRAA